MPSVTLHTVPLTVSKSNARTAPNALPPLLQTPFGHAIVEMQGTIHAPFPTSATFNAGETIETGVGRLEFPLFDPNAGDEDGKWMKKVYLYVGKHQRLTGEVKKLSKALAIVRKREVEGMANDAQGEELEIADVVRYKILFAARPEPVGVAG